MMLSIADNGALVGRLQRWTEESHAERTVGKIIKQLYTIPVFCLTLLGMGPGPFGLGFFCGKEA